MAPDEKKDEKKPEQPPEPYPKPGSIEEEWLAELHRRFPPKPGEPLFNSPEERASRPKCVKCETTMHSNEDMIAIEQGRDPDGKHPWAYMAFWAKILRREARHRRNREADEAEAEAENA